MQIVWTVGDVQNVKLSFTYIGINDADAGRWFASARGEGPYLGASQNREQKCCGIKRRVWHIEMELNLQSLT